MASIRSVLFANSAIFIFVTSASCMARYRDLVFRPFVCPSVRPSSFVTTLASNPTVQVRNSETLWGGGGGGVGWCDGAG